MSKKLDTHIQTQIEFITNKFPNVDKETVKNIVFTVLGNRTQGFVPAYEIEKQLGLISGYFSRAYKYQHEIKATIIKDEFNLLVKLDDEINTLLHTGYIGCKIDKDEAMHYDITINLTKNTLLGFYK